MDNWVPVRNLKRIIGLRTNSPFQEDAHQSRHYLWEFRYSILPLVLECYQKLNMVDGEMFLLGASDPLLDLPGKFLFALSSLPNFYMPKVEIFIICGELGKALIITKNQFNQIIDNLGYYIECLLDSTIICYIFSLSIDSI